jgi:hypothetical protein
MDAPAEVGGVGGSGATGGSGSGASGGKGGSGGTGGGLAFGGEAGEPTGPNTEPECTPGIPSTSQIPRLTNRQYDRAVRDLLEVTALTSSGTAPSALLAADHGGGLTDSGWAGYLAAGEAIAQQVMADPGRRGRFLACPADDADTACLHDSVVAFGRRAFRRPLTTEELARFDAIVAQGAEITPTGAPLEVAEVLLNTILVSPSFLQRSEISGAPNDDGSFVLSPYEIASRLSFMLWGSTPDPILEQAADAGELTTPEQIHAQAERLLADPRAREPVAAFHRAYVRDTPNGRWYQGKDPVRFPTFDDAALAAMRRESELFFEHLIFEQRGSFADFFTSPLGFVNATTAALYGLDPAGLGDELELVTLDAVQRPGFLTRVGFLSAFSYHDRTAPILRGAFITNDVLGLEVGPPTPEAVAAPVPSGDFETNRELTEARTAGGACSGCHTSYLNPPGFVLEAYDAVGAWQEVEADTGAPIDTKADVYIDGELVAVTAPADLMQRLAVSRDARHEYARRWVSFAYERDSHVLDSCTARDLGERLTDNGYTVLDLLVDLTQTESFRARVKDTP